MAIYLEVFSLAYPTKSQHFYSFLLSYPKQVSLQKWHCILLSCQKILVQAFLLCFLLTGYFFQPGWFVQGGFNFFREIQRDDATKSWYFWVYFDGAPAQAASLLAEFQLLNDKKEAVLTYRDEVVPLDISFQQVSLSTQTFRRKVSFVVPL